MASSASNNKMRVVSLVTLTVQNAAVALSMRYARTRTGDMFIASTAVLMAEVVKCVASLLLVLKQEASVQMCIMSVYTHVWHNKIDTLKVTVPAFVYLIQNNLLYVSASNLDAATYQVTYQLKILTTAVFAVLILGRVLQRTQWLALLLLCGGVALVQLAAGGSAEAAVSSEGQNKLLGVLAAVGACVCSGFAGIYFEKILKGSDISIWMRNVQLSLASLPLGLATSLATDWNDIIDRGFFHGYDAYVWYLVVLNATGGLLVAMVVKYADNILKNFATSLAIVLSMLASIAFFGFVLNIQYGVGTALVIASIFLYSYQPTVSKPLQKPQQTVSSISKTSGVDGVTQSRGVDRSIEATNYHHVVGDPSTANIGWQNISLFPVTVQPNGTNASPWQNKNVALPDSTLTSWLGAGNYCPSTAESQSGRNGPTISTAPTHASGHIVNEEAVREVSSSRASVPSSLTPGYYFYSQDWEERPLYGAESCQGQQWMASTEWEVVDPEEAGEN